MVLLYNGLIQGSNPVSYCRLQGYGTNSYHLCTWLSESVPAAVTIPLDSGDTRCCRKRPDAWQHRYIQNAHVQQMCLTSNVSDREAEQSIQEGTFAMRCMLAQAVSPGYQSNQAKRVTRCDEARQVWTRSSQHCCNIKT